MQRRRLFKLGVSVVVSSAVGACSTPSDKQETPGLLPRGTTLTTVKPTRQNLENKVSLSGKVTLNPVYGLEAPVSGQVRYQEVTPPTSTPTKATRVASVRSGNQTVNVDVPAGSVFLGRLVDDRSNVSAGMPIVSAKFAGYGIVADVDGAQAYKVVGALSSIKAQIQGGPGPFNCTALGSIAALPAGTVPPPPVDPLAPPQQQSNPGSSSSSEATGLRLVCVPPADVKMINGATATVEVITASAANALVLPVEAVAGTQGKGQVDIVQPDGSKVTKEVVLGLTDGRYVEIKSGLTGDETVAVPAPNLPAAPPQNNGKNGFPMPEFSK